MNKSFLFCKLSNYFWDRDWFGHRPTKPGYLQVSSNSFHDGGDDVIVVLERKNGQEAMTDCPRVLMLLLLCCSCNDF